MKTARIGGILALLKETAIHIESADRLSASGPDHTNKAQARTILERSRGESSKKRPDKTFMHQASPMPRALIECFISKSTLSQGEAHNAGRCAVAMANAACIPKRVSLNFPAAQ